MNSMINIIRLKNGFAYTLIKNTLGSSIIKSIGKYSPDINDNGFLPVTALMDTKVPATEAAAWIIIT